MLSGRDTKTEDYDPPATLRIGRLAELASVHVETLRYYERLGLLEKPYRSLSGYRAYPASAVAHVRAIKRAQALGFSLEEIRRLLKGARGERLSTHAARKLAELEGVLVELQRSRADLLRLVEYGCDGLDGCSCGRADCPTNVAARDLGAAPPPDVACTLSEAALGDREAEWRALLDSSLERGERIPSGARLTVQPSASGELKRLVDLERTCCTWMRFEFLSPETVSITASGDGADALVATFLDRDQKGGRPGRSFRAGAPARAG